MVPEYDYSLNWLWFLFLGMAVIIPFIVVYFDDGTVHKK